MDPAEALGALEVKDALRSAAVIPESPAEEFMQRSVDLPKELKDLPEIPPPSPGIDPSKPPLVIEIPRVPVAVASLSKAKQKQDNISPTALSWKGKRVAKDRPASSGSRASSPHWDHPSPSKPSESNKAHRQIHAWTTAVFPAHGGLGVTVAIDQVHMADKELENLIVGDSNLVKCLSELNGFQRQLVLDHVKTIGSTLEYVQIWKQERMTNVFGDLNLVILLWVTTRLSVEELKFNSEQFIRRREAERFVERPKGVGAYNQDTRSMRVSDDEDYAKRKMEQNYDADAKPVINFKDCVGRKFTFPFDLVRTWPVRLPALIPLLTLHHRE
jgi:hypothetical protein